MPVRRILSLLAALLICLVSQTGRSAEPRQSAAAKHVKLLTVGNSFTRDATRFLPNLAEAAGCRLTHQSLHIGGSPLQRHAEKALAFERDGATEASRYDNDLSLQEALQSDRWDFVTIQQLSIKSHDAATYQPHASQLADIVHRYAPQANLLIHQTWAYRSDDPRFDAKSDDPGEPNTQAEMYAGLSQAYDRITNTLAAGRLPVGDAFWIADNDPAFGYRADASFDPKSASYPSLPDQTHSLHVGYQWRQRDGAKQLRMDGHHASPAGQYLGACVWFACLFGESPIGNSFVPQGLDPPYAAFLQRVAWQAVQQAEDAPRGLPDQSISAFNDPNPGRKRFEVRASAIDPDVRQYPDINFVFGSEDKPQDLQRASVDTSVPPQGKLVIWLMGYNDALFERLNGYGLHAVQVSYANKWFGILCRPQPSDPYARGRVRLEAASGLDFSDELDLREPDGAAGRALRLVRWLDEQHPQGNWGQFLADGGTRLRWDKIVVSGSSHGSTTAARFAKHQRVDRVVMLCGPRDQDQDWQGIRSATPANRFFGFSHVLDGGWTGDHYCRSWELLGLHRFGPIVNVDSSAPPYEHSRRLISAADVGGDARRAHSSVTPGRSSPKSDAGDYLYEPVWRYLYTHPVDRVGEPTAEDPDCLRDHVND
jgi:hypothetical protein